LEKKPKEFNALLTTARQTAKTLVSSYEEQLEPIVMKARTEFAYSVAVLQPDSTFVPIQYGSDLQKSVVATHTDALKKIKEAREFFERRMQECKLEKF